MKKEQLIAIGLLYIISLNYYLTFVDDKDLHNHPDEPVKSRITNLYQSISSITASGTTSGASLVSGSINLTPFKKGGDYI